MTRALRLDGTSVAVSTIVPPEKGAGADVLILEDNDENRSFLQMLFEGQGYGVATAANGADALKWLTQHPPPAVILLDLNMPIMNGWEFCAALNGPLAEIPLVVLSAEADARAAARTLPAPCTFIEKPAIPDVLVQTVANRIQRGGRAAPQGPRL
jgi:CheY-like chemotaxis protein